MYSSFVSLGKFIPRYVIFIAVVNGIVSFISLTFLCYNNARYFCALILHPATLLNLLISSNNFLVASLGFSMYSIMSSVNSESLLLLIQCGFLFFFSLVVVARTSKAILNNGGKRGHPCFSEEMFSVYHH